jgi:transposase
MTRATLHSEDNATTPRKLLVALELGGTHWRLAASSGGTKITETQLAAGDVDGLERAITAAKARHGVAPTAPTVACYEAGRDGFWLHRELERRGVRSLVVDSASIEVNRRARRAKTDRLDARKLLAMLGRYDAGEATVWRVVRIPTVAEEDARRPHRELERLTKERTGHVNRIRALLALHGVRRAVRPTLLRELAAVTLPDGRPLPGQVRAEIARQWKRWALVAEQIRELEGQRRHQVTATDSPAARQVRQLTRLQGIGATSSWVMVQEVFAWRRLRNRRQAGALVGLTPTPYASDGLRREQGISKAGNHHVRRVLIQIAWGWLRYQRGSALSRWFHQRFGAGGGRLRRIGIVALARRLFIALWRWVEGGLIPEGATLRAA